MCGIFGLVEHSASSVSAKERRSVIRDLFIYSQARGTEAAGIAIAQNSSIKVFREAVSAADFVKDSRFKDLIAILDAKQASESFAVIGHSRLVTNGSQRNDLNNQPVITSGVVGVHNGIVVNDENLWTKYGTDDKLSDVDSEVIFYLIRKNLFGSKALTKSVKDTFKDLEGATSIAGLFTDFDQLLLATNNGSLYYCTLEDQNLTVFASERAILNQVVQDNFGNIEEGKIVHLRANTGVLVNFDGSAVSSFKFFENNGTALKLEQAGLPRKIERLESISKQGALSLEQEERLYEEQAAWADEHYPHDASFADSLKRCSKCILPETMPFIEFDSDGVCNYCRSYRSLELRGQEKLKKLADSIRRTDGKADCLVGISGGRDSCYGLHYLVKELGLHPVAYTFDWGMVTDLARRNISRLCGKLGIEHILVAADIPKKRSFIKKNVEAWLKRPSLGMVPLFMAGDKAYFYHANRLKQELGIGEVFLCENMLERTDFKTGFAGVKPYNLDSQHVYTLPLTARIKLALYYISQYLMNPGYINASLLDSLLAYKYYYLMPKQYRNLFTYIPWEEDKIITTLKSEYDWELADDTVSTWRIGDGTAAFYNLIYYSAKGFTENDSFRSNQIREGLLDRDEALRRVKEENKPRYKTLAWYCHMNNLNFPHLVPATRGEK